jgi:hypothetical protein
MLCGALAGAVWASDTTKTLSLSAQDIRRMDITSGAGSLNVSGRAGQAAIEVKAEIVARGVKDKEMEGFIRDHVELTLEKRGDAAVLVGRIRREDRLFRFGGNARIDLSVAVPKSLAVEIDDGSGGIAVEDVGGDLRIEDGSGSIGAVRITGNVVIDDGSGEVTVEHVGGNLEIDDGSGDIEVGDVRGDVEIDDGSGEVRVRRVGGMVTLDDGSGGIDIEDVGKDIRLISTGSGAVKISGEKGRVIRSR